MASLPDEIVAGLIERIVRSPYGGLPGLELVDAAATASCRARSKIGPGARETTMGSSISFVSAARPTDLVPTARVRRRGRAIATGDVSVSDPEGREVAVALVTYRLSAAG